MASDLTLSVLYPSEYLKAEDLKGRPVTVTISGVKVTAVPMAGGAKSDRVVITMRGTPKKLIAGKTNGYALGLLLGTDAKAWVGKRVTLIADVDVFGSEDVACIRVEGSPDAAPDLASAYARVWRGDRRRGALIDRIKRALAKLAPRQAAPSTAKSREDDPEVYVDDMVETHASVGDAPPDAAPTTPEPMEPGSGDGP